MLHAGSVPSSRAWYARERYWLSRSQCTIPPFGRLRRHSAICSASHTGLACIRSEGGQPTTRLASKSIKVARYSRPSSVHSQVMSSSHFWFAASAEKS